MKKPHIIFMLNALNYNIKFYVKDGKLAMKAPPDISSNQEIMSLIREHKEAIMAQLLLHPFDCARDGMVTTPFLKLFENRAIVLFYITHLLEEKIG